MKKLLLVSGDSFADPQFRSSSHPEMDVSWPKWPELMAKKLDMKLINLGRSGAGNEYISSSLQDVIVRLDDKSQIGLVIAGWSQCFRHDYQEISWHGEMEKTSWEKKSPEYATKKGKIVWKGEWSEDWHFDGDTETYNGGDMTKSKTIHDRMDANSIKKSAGATGWECIRVNTHGDIEGWVRKSLRTYMNFQLMCERYDIPYLHTQMIPMYIDYMRGLMPTEQEVALGATRENDSMLPSQVPEEELQKIILEYEGIMDPYKFVGWPISRFIGGYPLNLEVLGVWPDTGINEYVISELDNHPNKEGNQLIADHLLEKYEKTYC